MLPHRGVWGGPFAGSVRAVRIKLTSVPVSDQAQALVFYTQVLGFIKRRDEPAGEFRVLTVESREPPGGVELLLEPNAHPASRAYQEALSPMGYRPRCSSWMTSTASMGG